MNLIDNGIKEVLDVDRVILEADMYFEVKFIDWYGQERTKTFSSIENLEKKSWTE